MSYGALIGSWMCCPVCGRPGTSRACSTCRRWAKTYALEAVFRFADGDPVRLDGERFTSPWMTYGPLPSRWQLAVIDVRCRCTRRLKPKSECALSPSICYAEFYRTKEFEEGRVLYRQIP